MPKLLKISDATKLPIHYRLQLFTLSGFEKKKGSLRLPENFGDELKFEKEVISYKWATYAEGYEKHFGFFVFKETLSPFELHEALRKSLPMEALQKGITEIDVSTLSSSQCGLVLNAMGNLYALSQYQPEKFGRKATEDKKKKETDLNVVLKTKSPLALVENIFRTGYGEGRAANLVRELSELPGNELRPAQYLEKLKKVAKEMKLNLSFFDQKALEKLGAGSFLAVVRANPTEVYGIAKLHHKPKNAKKKVALVGKGLCFDTGGYNIKVGEGMFDMHRDMTGSAVVLALMKHLIEENTDIEIEAYLALAENLISPSAYRPNDVVIASNGISIEVVDTDAEGRMVLADTLVMASREKPDLIIDYATLTGAVIRSLGTARSGVFSNHQRLMDVALKAGTDVGERVWGFPIGEDYRSGLDSEYADVKQCGPGNHCDHIYAATFLSLFVENKVPWLHVDLAAESNKGGLGLSSREITGFGVRLGKRVIEAFLTSTKA